MGIAKFASILRATLPVLKLSQVLLLRIYAHHYVVMALSSRMKPVMMEMLMIGMGALPNDKSRKRRFIYKNRRLPLNTRIL